ncbi:MAG: DNA-formamidopyrimidine glycosylase family protein [Patescibacteria group bacterium]
MPELPEIETVKLQLQKVLIGQVCLKSDFKEIVGKKVISLDRKGKALLINFGKDLDLGFHFKMTGQLIYDDGKKRIAGGHPSEDMRAKLPNKHTRAVFEFEKGTLFFNDMRRFGWIKINPKFVSTLGEDALTITTLKKSSKPIKIAIMDQTLIAGVGNIYANDALWEAGIDPRVPSNKVTSDRAELLLEKIKLVLEDGIKYGGASMSDYVDANGEGGSYQNHFRVYKQDGKQCQRCKSVIKKIVMGGRGTYYCPECQK